MDLTETDARGDVYALGKILYEAMCGRMVDTRTACPLKGVCLPDPNTPFLHALDQVVQQATAEDKEIRTASVKALRQALEKVLDEADARERPVLKGLHRKQIIAIGIAVLVIAAVSNLYHHFVMVHEPSAPPTTPVPETTHERRTPPEAPKEIVEPKDQSPPLIYMPKHGATMHLIPGGLVKLPNYAGSEAGKPFELAPFYMDETEVSNYKYVEFLNQMLARIQVFQGTVHGEGRPWLRLGPVYGGYEPIVYVNGRFALKDASAAFFPVVKVTGYGASAYADFYAARLPTELEWLHAMERGQGESRSGQEVAAGPTAPATDLEKEMEGWLGAYQEGSTRRTTAPESESPARIPHPVGSFQPNTDGIRGLGANVSEWGLRPGRSGTAEAQYVILGGLRGWVVRGQVVIPGIAQEPSGAFEDVG